MTPILIFCSGVYLVLFFHSFFNPFIDNYTSNNDNNCSDHLVSPSF